MRIDTTSGEFDFTYLSLGAGVQSSALLVLGCTDPRVPKPDYAIFADTGDEPPWVYEYVEFLTIWAAVRGVAVVRVQHGSGQSLSDWVLHRRNDGKRFVSIPVFTSTGDRVVCGGCGALVTESVCPGCGSEEVVVVKQGSGRGMLRRQCTREFKLEPIQQKVRELLGYKPRQRIKARVRAMLGITIDEATRMKESITPWVTNTYPLVDLGLHRNDCIAIVESVGLPRPQKSACVYCPYHSDAYWAWMKETHPGVFAEAVQFDTDIRNMTMQGEDRPAFLHRTLQPLGDVDFDAGSDQVDLFDMSGECEGMCGV